MSNWTLPTEWNAEQRVRVAYLLGQSKKRVAAAKCLELVLNANPETLNERANRKKIEDALDDPL